MNEKKVKICSGPNCKKQIGENDPKVTDGCYYTNPEKEPWYCSDECLAHHHRELYQRR